MVSCSTFLAVARGVSRARPFYVFVGMALSSGVLAYINLRLFSRQSGGRLNLIDQGPCFGQVQRCCVALCEGYSVGRLQGRSG